jgi:hypothetical protein
MALSAPKCFRLSSVKLKKVWPAMARPDDEAQHHGHAEVDRDAGVLEVVLHRHLLEVVARHGPEAVTGLDARRHRVRVLPRGRVRQHEGQQLALARRELRGARVGRVHHGLALEGARDAADAHHDGAVVIELERVAHGQRMAGPSGPAALRASFPRAPTSSTITPSARRRSARLPCSISAGPP